MKEFLEYLVTNIAKNPSDVTVTEIVDGNTFVYQISVNPDDMGLVIGREGRIIQSIRALAKSKAIKEGIMINVELLEPGEEPGVAPAAGEEAVEVAEEVVEEAAEEVVEEVAEEATEEVVEEAAEEVATE